MKLSLVLTLLLSSSTVAQEFTGARRPTPYEWARSEVEFEKTHKALPNGLGRARRLADFRAAGATPTAVDNSLLLAFPPIRNQGSQNSCAQFAGTYYALTHMTALARGWNAKSGGDAFRFSPKWTYNFLNGGGNNGTTVYDAYGIAKKHGVATWAQFPYDTNYRTWCMNPDVWFQALSFRADTSGKVPKINTDTGLAALKQLLANGYVLNIATYINSWSWSSFKDDPSTSADNAFVGKAVARQASGAAGGHAITIVGYNDSVWLDVDNDGVVDTGEKGALRIANSWGTGWREGGFSWISYNALRVRNPSYSSEGLAWYDEALWVTARTSYTPKLVAQFSLSHLKRKELYMTLGTSGPGNLVPTTTWAPSRVLSGSGGNYAFNGTTTAVVGGFYLDLTDILQTGPGLTRYYLGMRDSLALNPATMLGFALFDVTHNRQIMFSGTPLVADSSTVYARVDYDYFAAP